MKQLALLGGTPTIKEAFPPYSSIGKEEEEAVSEVMRSGVLSAYVGARGKSFLGGPRVNAFEAACAEYFNVRHVVAVNSWTSGLITCIGAIGLEPGDEVIVTPWTMAATATAILHWNCIPVFADIDLRTFNLDPVAVERLITPQTKAIMVADIFGQSADIQAFRRLAKRYDLKLIGDTAQAPGALINQQFTGTLTDIGGFSLNYHKHIHCGEGGIIVTNDEFLAKRSQLIRNHAEAVIDSDDPHVLANMLGYNFRMGEIEAAIGLEQLKKLSVKIASRQRAANQLNQALSQLLGLSIPFVQENCTHVYYIYGIIIDFDLLRIDRTRLVAALRAEGVPGLLEGYQNLHRLPLFRNRIAYGRRGFPWTSELCKRDIFYQYGDCPVAENLHDRSFIGLNLCAHDYDEEQVQLIINAFEKVWMNIEQLAY